jgi:hypothetical protein
MARISMARISALHLDSIRETRADKAYVSATSLLAERVDALARHFLVIPINLWILRLTKAIC